jgi:hypothetical protein
MSGCKKLHELALCIFPRRQKVSTHKGDTVIPAVHGVEESTVRTRAQHSSPFSNFSSDVHETLTR